MGLLTSAILVAENAIPAFSENVSRGIRNSAKLIKEKGKHEKREKGTKTVATR
jgi:hypothetical protein